MRCEIIAVGTELLLGHITDTNSAWIGRELALAGIDSYLQTKVGDNHKRIVEAVRDALERSDAVIMCGGLGPTQDDLTREAIAEVMGVSVARDPTIADAIRRRFESRGRDMPQNNLKQADVPDGAHTIAQMPGTAPGLVCPVGNKVIYAVPGVPSEMKEMLSGTVLDDLKRRAGVNAVIHTRVLRTWGKAESALAEILAERIGELDQLGNPLLAFQASGIEGIKVRISAKARNTEAADAILDAEETLIRGLLGDIVFGVDEQNMEAAVLDMLRHRGLTLATAESLTGGMIGTRLTAVAGASDVFRGALVTYATESKFKLLGVPRGPVVCAQAAMAMATGAQKAFDADVGIAATGVAGPTQQEGKAVGTVFLGLAIGTHVEAQEVSLPGDREQIRRYTVISALNKLRLKLLTN
jgi:nicotinamide-nucleotide amidase